MTKQLVQRPMPDWAYHCEPDRFVTLLASDKLDGTTLDSCLHAIQAVDPSASQQWRRHSTNCVECTFSATGGAAFALLQDVSIRHPSIDVFVLPLDRRQIKLLICDMDSTIIPTESLDELASHLGIGDQIAAITARAMAGEMAFKEALLARVSQLKGLDVDAVNRCVQQTTYNPGAESLLLSAKRSGVRTVLVSGGFSPFVEYVAEQLGFDRWVANRLVVEQQQLTGEVERPIVDKHTKLEVLQNECQAMAIESAQTCAIGDGANDIEMLTAAGCGVAYRAKPIVLKSTPYHLQSADFSTLGYLFEWQ